MRLFWTSYRRWKCCDPESSVAGPVIVNHLLDLLARQSEAFVFAIFYENQIASEKVSKVFASGNKDEAVLDIIQVPEMLSSLSHGSWISNGEALPLCAR